MMPHPVEHTLNGVYFRLISKCHETRRRAEFLCSTIAYVFLDLLQELLMNSQYYPGHIMNEHKVVGLLKVITSACYLYYSQRNGPVRLISHHVHSNPAVAKVGVKPCLSGKQSRHKELHGFGTIRVQPTCMNASLSTSFYAEHQGCRDRWDTETALRKLTIYGEKDRCK